MNLPDVIGIVAIVGVFGTALWFAWKVVHYR